MEPKIDSVVLGPNGHRATVSGPINWDDDETSATFSAAITQVKADNGHITLAAGQNTAAFTPSQSRWSVEVTVTGAGQLTDGSCNGWATASVLETSGSYEAYPWKVNGIPVTGAQDVVGPRK
jgi:hypothetical protein